MDAARYFEEMHLAMSSQNPEYRLVLSVKVPGTYVSTYRNQDLTWEKTAITNVGLASVAAAPK